MGTTNVIELPKNESEHIKDYHDENYDLCNWIDITSEFFEASKNLALGELVHDESFGLLEAMSAIEMMDPKMDVGMLCHKENYNPVDFHSAIKIGKLKIKELAADELINVFDYSWSCLSTWLEGHSLAQTVFINLYLHKPHEIQDSCLKAFSFGFLKLVEVIKDFITRAAVYEEEDFQPMLYGYKLAPDIPELKVCNMLKEVEEEYFKKMKATRCKQGEIWDMKTQQQHESALALHARIKFLRMLYQALLSFNRKDCSGTGDAERFLRICSELLDTISKTINKELLQKIQEEGTNLSLMGFEPLVNQRMLPPTFPRYTYIKNTEEMLDYLNGLISRLRKVCEIVELVQFHQALDFLWEFSRQKPCVLSRSIPQILYLPQGGKIFGVFNFVTVLKEACKNFICPPALSPKCSLLNNQQCRDCVESFLEHCIQPFISLIQISGHNRARQRDKLAILLEDFAGLQEEADKTDAYLHQMGMRTENPKPHLACFSTWILYHILKIMIQFLLSGFELELYSLHEYHYIYWYLYEFLFGWYISAISRADAFLMEQEYVQESGKNINVRKPKGKKKRVRPYGKEIATSRGLQYLCAGLFKVIIGLRISNKIPQPYSEFDNEQVRYEHRFLPFAKITTPLIVPYSQFQEATNLFHIEWLRPIEECFLSACKSLHQSKNYFEMIGNPSPEVENLLKIVKTNFVVAKLLSDGHKKDSTLTPIFDFALHPSFPIIRFR